MQVTRLPVLFLAVALALLSVAIAATGQSCTEEQAQQRSLSGHCNNLAFPGRGASGTTMVHYHGVQSEPITSPNTRLLSNEFLAERPFKPSGLYSTEERRTGLTRDPHNRNTMISGFQQLIGHDVSLTRLKECFTPDCFIDSPILDENDPLYMTKDKFPHIPTDRTGLFVPRGDVVTAANGTIYPMNDQSHYLDGSAIYGASDEVLNKLRAHVDGLMLARYDVGDGIGHPMQSFEELPDSKVLNVPNQCSMFGPFGMASGDLRTETNSVLAAVHTLFVREHNRLARTFKRKNPSWSDERLFQEARKFNIAIFQHISFNEVLPVQFGASEYALEVGPYTGYDANVDVSLSTAFAVSANRIPHDQVSLPMLVLKRDGSRPEMPPTVGFEDIERINCVADKFWEFGTNAIIRGGLQQYSQKFDGKVVDDMRSFPAQGTTALPYNFDVKVMDIEREREALVPGYYEMRKVLFGQDIFQMAGCSEAPEGQSDPLECFLHISSDVDTATKLRNIYGKLRAVDFHIGMSVESIRTSTDFPLSGAKVWLRQMRRIRDGDRWWYENTANGLFNARELAEIKKTRFRDLVLRNTDLSPSEVFVNGFYVHPRFRK